MLSAIVAVTLLAPDVQAVERAYQQVLDYHTAERGQLAAEQAESWGAKCSARAASTSSSSRLRRPRVQRLPVMTSRDVRRAGLDQRG